jgi:uncharacterized protein YbcI
MEAEICDRLSAFEREYMGRGPKGIRAHLFGDLLLVRLHGMLSEAEKVLVEARQTEAGVGLYTQFRAHLFDIARPAMDLVIEKVTGVKVRSAHHEFSQATNEEFLLFVLATAPNCREPRTRRSHSHRFPELRIN